MKYLFQIFIIGLFVSASAVAQEINQSERDQAVIENVKNLETQVDPENGLPWGSHRSAKGYHSNFERGTKTHPTRAAMDLAAWYLLSPKPEYHEKGRILLEKVLALQDQDPKSRTFGVWPWYAEEPLGQMASVDFNWADFQGAVLTVILRDCSDRLTDELREKTKKSLEYCCRAIIKRNVGPGYTNIAIMGSTVTAAAGEMLDMPEFLDYGRKRIKNNLDYFHKVGGFNEYNSPAYTTIVIAELERMLYLVKDPECRETSRKLLDEAWKVVAFHYHVPTAQWAGPHSRAYSDVLSAKSRDRILYRAGLLPQNDPIDLLRMVPMLPIPEPLCPMFSKTPETDIERHDVFAKGRPYFEETGTTWMNRTVALGTASYHTFWEQSRGLIAYWKLPNETTPAVLRLRFLHNGNDFASGCARHRQTSGKVLSTVGLIRNWGSMHPSFDCPKDGVFKAKSFRIEYQLTAMGATIRELDSTRFELAAGPIRAIIHVMPESVFFGSPIRWKTEQKDDCVSLVGTCYEGEEKEFPLRKATEPTRIALGLELLQNGETPSDTGPQFGESDVKTDDGLFYGVTWPDVWKGGPLISPLFPANR